MAVVFGLRDLQAAFADADRQLRLGIRGGLRQIAEPVRQGAEELAMSTMRNMPRSPRWSKMRIGITRDLVYVAPRQRGTKGRGYDPRRRGEGYAHPPFSDLVMLRAMEPALERHAAEVEHGFEEILANVTDGFNHGGILMARITVNGREYELVPLDDLTLDEAMVVWDYTGMSLDQVPEIEGFHPGLIKALLHISVARGEPGEPARAIKEAVGGIKVAELNSVFMEISEEVEDPPTAPAPPSLPGGSGAVSSSTGESAPDLSGPNGSGLPGSDTGATSVPVTSPI